MVDPDERPAGGGGDAELLLELPGEPRLDRLAGVELAPRELPEPALVGVVRPAREEDAAGGVDDSGRGDVEPPARRSGGLRYGTRR
jgi:hypothetical protein